MKGFVLAAGLGERLLPITQTVPKPLLPVGNLPLIAYALKLLAAHGITDVIVNLHHLAKTMREALGDGSAFGVEITYSVEEEILGTGGGLKNMHEHLTDDSFVVINSDTVIDVDLQPIIAAHQDNGALATMVLREDPQQAEYGQIEIDGSGRIRRLLGQGEQADGLRPLMFAGVHVLTPRFLEYIPPDVNTCVNRYAYSKALRNDEVLQGVAVDGYWADAGTPERYYQTNVDALEQLMKLKHADPLSGFAVAPKREVAEVVRMGEDVDLGNGVHILPPVLLGDNVRVGDNATVGPYAVIGPRSTIGREANVSKSLLLEAAKVEPGARMQRVIQSKKGAIRLDEAS